MADLREMAQTAHAENVRQDGGPGSGPKGGGGGIRHPDNKAFGSSPAFEKKVKAEKKFKGLVLREKQRLLNKHGGNEARAHEKAEGNMRKKHGDPSR